ncbi:hypothetical protein PENSPDRAFT_655822 [Peniophora sp. CONT]|nr:hypothetical protein PENSPDRAFT_655822 [Peniophora sp. CONT]
MDVELQIIQKHLALTRRKRNAFVGACKLPAELLSDIFRLVQSEWKPLSWKRSDAKYPSATLYSLGWMSLSHVCSAWRKVSVNDSHLWSSIDCLAVPSCAMHTILARSGRSPLSLTFVSAKDYDDNISPFCDMWLSPVVRLRVEALTMTFRDEFAPNHLPLRLPHLRKLAINYDKFGKTVTHVFPKDGPCYPKLTQLTLTNYTVTWDSLIITSTLTHLHWSLDSSGTPANYLPVSDFTRLLARMPALKYLHLSNALKTTSRKQVKAKHTLPISLEFIRLSFWDESPVSALFNYIEIPPTTSVVIDFYSCNTPSDVSAVAAALLQGAFAYESEPRELLIEDGCYYLRPWLAEPLKTRHLDVHFRDVVDFGEPRSRCLLLQDSDGEMSDRWDGDEDETWDMEDARRFLPYVPLACVTAITFCSHFEHFLNTVTSWFSSFSIAREVRHICLRASDQVIPLCTALEETTNSDFILFPLLETITLGEPYEDLETDKNAQTHLVLSVVSVLEKRREGGAAIRELRVARNVEAWSGDPWVAVRELVQLSFFN